MKPTKPTPVRFEPAEADIQKCAYFLWKEAGGVPGHEVDFWLAAKERLRHRPHEPHHETSRHSRLTR